MSTIYGRCVVGLEQLCKVSVLLLEAYLEARDLLYEVLLVLN